MLEDPKLYYINLKYHATSVEANIRRNEVVFMVKDLTKRTELLAVDVVKENSMTASLSILSNTGYTDFNFLLEMMLKAVIMVAKKKRTLC